MYTKNKALQVLISLLKQYNVRDLVLSAGQSNRSFCNSVETDDFFTCYSVVDERSAAFFAMGIAQQKGVPVAISCTSSTAACNYLSAITESFYQEVPVLVLTSAKDVRDLGNCKLLNIKQDDIFKDVIKYKCQLPRIVDAKDLRYTERLINESLIALGDGPVHINIPDYGDSQAVEVDNLPTYNKINLWNSDEFEKNINDFHQELIKKERVLLFCGQARYDEKTQALISEFESKYNCVVASESFANLSGVKNKINLTPFALSNTLDTLSPDLVITFGKHSLMPLRTKSKIPHWAVNANGVLRDTTGFLSDVFQMKEESFMKKLADNSTLENNRKFYREVLELAQLVAVDDFPFSHVKVMSQFIPKIPEKSILHLSILNSIRLTQYFSLHTSVKTYGNLGALGIDGSMSTFMGQSYATDEKAFLVVGDLSFFYDMNSLMIKHIKNNVRILLLNNGGGAEFYQNNKLYKELDLHTAAAHEHSAKNWAQTCQFSYLCASDEDELLVQMNDFLDDSDRPIILEVFTNKQTDKLALDKLYSLYRQTTIESMIKDKAKSVLSRNEFSGLRKILRK